MAVIGTILGDIAGSQYEFNRPKDLDYHNCELFTDKCVFTDDTVMTLAAKLAVRNHIPFADSYREFGDKYPHAGYGGKFRMWLRYDNAEAYGSYGNGSAMRCSYIGEHFNSEKEVEEWAAKSAECTHNHPEGIKGAVVTTKCIYMAQTGSLKITGMSINGVSSCQGSVPAAIRCFIESEDYVSFLRNVFSLPCDTDTLCAIGGGIAEEYYKGTGLDADALLKKYLDDTLYGIVNV